MRPDRALVVRGAPSVEPVLGQQVVGHVGQAQDRRTLLRGPTTQYGLEGRGLEPPGRGCRLDVEMAVDQDRAAGTGERKQTVKCWIPSRLHYLRPDAAGLYCLNQPLSACSDTHRVLAHPIKQ